MTEPVSALGGAARGDRAGPADSDSGRLRLACFAIAFALVLVPLLSVRIPPSGDLPQQLHQIVLAERAARGLEPELQVDWLWPNRLGYLPLAIGWSVGGAREAPRIALALIALFWVGSIHLFAWRSRIDVALPVLASAFLFNRLLYCGFLNFLCGIVAILFCLRELERDASRASALRIAGGAFVGALLLYASHVLWLAGGGVIVLTASLLHRFRPRTLLLRALGATPVLVHFLFWAVDFGGAGWQTAVRWAIPPLDRIDSLPAFTELVLGGLRGRLEPVVVAVALLFLVLGAARAIRERGGSEGRAAVRVVPLVAGASCLLAAVLLPTQVDLTVFLDARWAPFAMVFLLLALPPPNVRPAIARALAIATLAAMSIATTAAWLRYDREDLAGFDEAVAAIPEQAKVIGLDLGEPSRYLRWHPFENLFAWPGVERNARPSRSFVELASSLVTLRDPERRPSWLPRRDDDVIWVASLGNYDYALVRGPAERVARLRASAPPTAIVVSGPAWTLLSMRPSGAAEDR